MSEPLPSLSIDDAASLAKADPILSQNTEPGFANTYGPGTHKPSAQFAVALPAAGVGALSLYLLYRKHQQDQRDKLNELGLDVPPDVSQEKRAKIDWNAVQAQLPGLHAPDLLLGGAAGAGAGALYDYVRGSPKGRRALTALRRILTGAVLGAGVTNLAGDRARRYISNSVLGPYGYDAESTLAQLKPRSLEHLRDALVYDKPNYDPKQLEKILPHFAGRKDLALLNANARRELQRIAYGVHKHDPNTSFWQKNKGDKGPDYYSLNESNPNYSKNVNTLMLPTTWHPLSVLPYAEMKKSYPPEHPLQQLTEQEYLKLRGNNGDTHALFTNPTSTMRFINSGLIPGTAAAAALSQDTDVMGKSLLGARQLVTRPSGDNIEGALLDRWDITPTQKDTAKLRADILGGKFLSPSWWKQRAFENSQDYTGQQNNAQFTGSTLSRLLWDRVLEQEHPWVMQKFKYEPVPSLSGATQPEYRLQFQKNDGSPAGEPIDRINMMQYLDKLYSESPQASGTSP